MATIKDVAREAGVSLGTVSNVLNGKESVQRQNKEKVYKAMKKLGFHYNMTASALRTKTTKNIGLIIPTITNPYYPELARGVEDAARMAGLTVFLCNNDRDPDKERKYVDALLSKGVDGLILVKPMMGWEELRELNQHTALVLADVGHAEVEDAAGFSIVNVEDEMGIIQGMTLLEQYGHKQIAFISGMMESYSSRIRMRAYQKCLESRGIRYQEEYIVSGDYSWKSGYTAARQLLNLTNPPTAIFAANDIMAIGAIKAIFAKGLRIPEDISVIGFDDIEMSILCTPSLTTIHQPKYEVGIEGVRLLSGRFNRDEMEISEIMNLETKMIFRESVGFSP